jgi:hypothetical protein
MSMKMNGRPPLEMRKYEKSCNLHIFFDSFSFFVLTFYILMVCFFMGDVQGQEWTKWTRWTIMECDEGLSRPCPVRVPSVSRPCPVRVKSV